MKQRRETLWERREGEGGEGDLERLKRRLLVMEKEAIVEMG